MSKSIVWNYFKLDNEKKSVKCGLCHVVMKHNKLSTSNMMRHMRLKHPTIDLNRQRHNSREEDENGIDDPRAVVVENPSVSNSVSIFIILK